MEAHGGRLAVEVLRRYGVDTMFTLSGGHLFVLYDGAVQSDDMRLIDARHEHALLVVDPERVRYSDHDNPAVNGVVRREDQPVAEPARRFATQEAGDGPDNAAD